MQSMRVLTLFATVAVLSVVSLPLMSGPAIAEAADTTGASAVLDLLLGSANAWSYRIVLAAVVMGLAVIALTHFQDLRSIIAIPMTMAIIGALIVWSPQLVTAVGLVAGATIAPDMMP